MINSKVDHCTTLEEFYKEIRRQQEEGHGHDYCRQHDAIVRYMAKCDRYKELGTHQGATAAAAILTNPVSAELVDISMEKYNASKHLFEDYCEKHNIELIVKEMGSTDPRSVGHCDLLLIDSMHNPHHMTKELSLHADYVHKYIICHDTSIVNGRQNDSLYQTLERFVSGINPWVVIERNTENVGYTVIGNTLNI